jgi:hypothetical protein
MRRMTNATAAPSTRIILVGDRDRPGAEQGAPAIRRFRLARLHVNGRPSEAGPSSPLRRRQV